MDELRGLFAQPRVHRSLVRTLLLRELLLGCLLCLACHRNVRVHRFRLVRHAHGAAISHQRVFQRVALSQLFRSLNHSGNIG